MRAHHAVVQVDVAAAAMENAPAWSAWDSFLCDITGACAPDRKTVAESAALLAGSGNAAAGRSLTAG
jgi:hypothetical protein